LFLPKFDKVSKPVERIDNIPSTASTASLVKYDPETHIRKQNKSTSSNAPVEMFEGLTPVSSTVGSDFDL
jgi:hypothetical protein